MNAAEFSRLTAAVRGRVRAMVGRAVIAAVNDGLKAQALQLQLLEGETLDGVERYQDYGFTSHPHPGAEALMVSVGGLRSHGIVVAIEDRRYRLKALQAGEVALYDDQGQVVHLTRDGVLIKTGKTISIEADEDVVIAALGEVNVQAPSVVVTADSVDLGGAGGPAVARVGDSVAGGVITTGSAKVKAA